MADRNVGTWHAARVSGCATCGTSLYRRTPSPCRVRGCGALCCSRACRTEHVAAAHPNVAHRIVA